MPINIETIILVAVWNNPTVFQGVFKISTLDGANKSIFLFFRCEYENQHEKSAVDDDFQVSDYRFSHLYNDIQLVQLHESSAGGDYAEYVLKYALYMTALKMGSSQKQKLTVIDEQAMKALIKRVEPLLKQDGTWIASESDIGFAAAIDFTPHEKMGQIAVTILLNLDSNSNTTQELH